jgi:hypothetical protein
VRSACSIVNAVLVHHVHVCVHSAKRRSSEIWAVYPYCLLPLSLSVCMSFSRLLLATDKRERTRGPMYPGCLAWTPRLCPPSCGGPLLDMRAYQGIHHCSFLSRPRPHTFLSQGLRIVPKSQVAKEEKAR